MLLSSILSFPLLISPFSVSASLTNFYSKSQPKQQPLHDCADSTSDPLEQARRDGFYFENPETECKHTSQPFIFNAFKTLEADKKNLFTYIHPDVDFTVTGYHPLAGHYKNFKLFFINAVWRIGFTYSEAPESFDIQVNGIHAGCTTPWSIQEMQFSMRTNAGRDVTVYNIWVTRWENNRMVEIRTYVDAMKVSEMIRENEVWWNQTQHVDRTTYEPGPNPMPDEGELDRMLASYGHYDVK